MKEKTSSGLGLGTTLFLIFLVLKLTGVGPVAEWSWWWVTCPLWATFALLVCVWLFIGVLIVIPFTVGMMLHITKKILNKEPLK